MRCRICGNQGGKTHKVKEMMFGFRDEFEYLECPSCGCLQIASIVPDIGKYYPPSKYYSFNSPKLNPLFNWVIKERDRWTLLRRGYVGMFLARGRPDRLLGEISALGVTEDQRVLDVGCGDGFLLRRMRGWASRGSPG